MSEDPLSVCCRHLANSQHIIEAKDDEIARLRLTDAEREAIGVAIQCVVAAKAQRHPEEEESHELLHKTAAILRGLFDRTK